MTSIRPPSADAPPRETARDPRWARIMARDEGADGLFYYSVVTTGVYCRPSCPSRRPRADNATIHATLADARATGFRPCRRCRPDEQAPAAANAARISRAVRAIEAAETPLPLATLAAAAGLSAGHFHRMFKSATGLTPRGYAVAHRAGRLRAALRKSGTVTHAIHAAGFGSSGRAYASTSATLGMTPRRYRAGGVAETLRHATGRSTLGLVLVAASNTGIAAILLGDDEAALVEDLRSRFPHAQLIAGDAAHADRVAAVIALVDRPALGLDLPLDIRGTAFQQRVWQALTRIAPGDTASYAGVAEAIGAPRSARAVAAACAANPIAVAIPCHRVVGRDGALAGYRWGLARKRALLDREASAGDDDAG